LRLPVQHRKMLRYPAANPRNSVGITGQRRWLESP
jgi:hypothetical protein